MKEKVIPNFTKYKARQNGEIINEKNQVLKGYRTDKKVPTLRLYKDGGKNGNKKERTNINVPELIATLFISPKPSDKSICSFH